MDFDLKRRKFLVTGESSGIGLATVRMLLEEGARVATCARNPYSLDEALSDLVNHYGESNLFYALCDVRDPDEITILVARAAEKLGGLDGLVNNAGASLGKNLYETTLRQWRDELELKFFSVLVPILAAIPYLR